LILELQQKKKEEQDRIDKVEAFKKLDIDTNGWYVLKKSK